MTDVLSMHRTFLSEIKAKRESLERELQRLAAVEQYHDDAVRQLSGDALPTGEDEQPAVKPISTPTQDPRLVGLKKHDACEISLRELGGKAKTPDVAQWLRSRGYGVELTAKILVASCYTAMNRKPGTFQKTKDGAWELVVSGQAVAGDEQG